ncbi:hypothetical protein JQX09_09835 [Sulfitobacter pseudonitzschiae]|uniref:YeeE/YedE family protein n=1 Tax=Pseudosulfitobacter pseudonitzschiae TaxID=1402135 RepID=A0A9Q2NLL2_9RHOB|nr:DUF6691 family protein [Pseudosulfitobacter pseudonitzschiae]MBM2292213.1 hypothetical protein [Pseudosulfitobacter pseudonitzschiae]MBM2297131.1 hypothetical protein [Pseudosulfitobacter pseudonitzschiae]MBM2302045.1 hypothetical protein [Pseudosulfitobacter pseudonitzschiae]MBM2311827.1 hypothetical protein [Pseudosulfitobacter pseudonitzschiae]MBM2316741.1 hypothetical protein [Pseudosulfitobacter pseudonitzschiae]
MRLIIAVIAGGLFGLGLHLSGMTDTNRVQGFLDIFSAWDPTLAFVMGGAIVPMAVAWRLTAGRKPLVGSMFPSRPSTEITRRLVIGSVLFGIGWGLVGLCPGPAMASLGYGGIPGVVFLVAMMVGMAAAPRVSQILDRRTASA